MSLAFVIYLAGVITNVASFISLIFITSIVLFSLYTVGYLMSNESSWKTRGKFYKWPLVLILTCGTISTLLPSERTLWMIAGAYTGEKVMESTIGKQTVELIELKLAEELDVIKSKVKEKTK